MVDMI